MSEKQKNIDLNKPIENEVQMNQTIISRGEYILRHDGYARKFNPPNLFVLARLRSRVAAEIGWFEGISTHGPSVGSFYESLIYSSVLEILPSSLKFGHGFIYDSNTGLVSSQIDLIIYDDSLRPPIYKRDLFVVVDSSVVVSCSEIKKTLTDNNLRKIIRNVLNLNLGSSPLAFHNVQYINIFAFQTKLSIERIFKIVSSEFEQFLLKFKNKTKEGEDLTHALFHIVVPRVFVFDKDEFVNSHVTADQNNFECNIALSVFGTSYTGSGGLGEFFTYIVSKSYVPLIDHNFFSSSLLLQRKDVGIAEFKIPVMRYFDIDRIFELFPNSEKIFSSNAAKNSSLPYGFLLPTVIDTSNIKSLSELIKTKGFSWQVFNPKSNTNVDT